MIKKNLEICVYGSVSLFNRHINFCGLFNAKTILLEEQQWYY